MLWECSTGPQFCWDDSTLIPSFRYWRSWVLPRIIYLSCLLISLKSCLVLVFLHAWWVLFMWPWYLFIFTNKRRPENDALVLSNIYYDRRGWQAIRKLLVGCFVWQEMYYVIVLNVSLYSNSCVFLMVFLSLSGSFIILVLPFDFEARKFSCVNGFFLAE